MGAGEIMKQFNWKVLIHNSNSTVKELQVSHFIWEWDLQRNQFKMYKAVSFQKKNLFAWKVDGYL